MQFIILEYNETYISDVDDHWKEQNDRFAENIKSICIFLLWISLHD